MELKKTKAYIGFDKLAKKLQRTGKSPERAKALASWIGRKKYGKKKFQNAAARGRKLGHG